jgi:hypothetical protein
MAKHKRLRAHAHGRSRGVRIPKRVRTFRARRKARLG